MIKLGPIILGHFKHILMIYLVFISLHYCMFKATKTDALVPKFSDIPEEHCHSRNTGFISIYIAFLQKEHFSVAYQI